MFEAVLSLLTALPFTHCSNSIAGAALSLSDTVLHAAQAHIHDSQEY